MNEDLNLVEILKDCPEGNKLYSTVLGEVELCAANYDNIYPICVKDNIGNTGWLTSSGKFIEKFDGECILFPSQDQRDWSKFNPKNKELVPPCEFKDGDILSYQCAYLKNRSIYIYRYHKTLNTAYYVALSGNTDSTFRINNKGKCALNGYDHTVRFATEEEKQKLFDAIKENGYKWNAKTKTLEKLIKLKFDPKTLQPFDKILARDYDTCKWKIDFYSHKEVDSGFPYICAGNSLYKYCIPYNDDTKHLVGTTEEAPEYYRYWENI